MDTDDQAPLSRTDAAGAAHDAGWRFLLGGLETRVATGSPREGLAVLATAVEAVGDAADEHLWVDLRTRHVDLRLRSPEVGGVTAADGALARAVTAALAAAGSSTRSGSEGGGGPGPLQRLELAIDATDVARVRPFWKAVLGYVGETPQEGPLDALVDPAGRLPTVWFQQMEAPRPQRNRIHLDLTVAHEVAEARVAAAVAAGGVVVDDASARAFWVLADPEGNEVCVCTWQDRD